MNAGAVIGNLGWFAASLPEYRRFKRDAYKVEETQRRQLRYYLKQNAETAFGREHGFANIDSWEEYSDRVPIRDYDAIEPWISRIAAGEGGVLTTDPVKLFEPSSGSSGPAKLIPFTRALQREIRRAVALWSAHNFLSQPDLLLGRAYWSLTPQMNVPQSVESVIPVGFDEDSAYLGGIARHLINRTLATHPALLHVNDMEKFWHLTLLTLLQCADLRLISVWHPSYLQLLIERLRKNWTLLLSDLEEGLTSADPAQQFRRNPARTHKLRSSGCDNLSLIWPKLRLISCWADGHAASSIPQLESLFPGTTIQGKGLVATEAFVTVPLGRRKPLAIRSHVFEFLGDNDKSYAPWQLEKGATYTVVVTTGGGLYRYRLGDQIQVEDFYGDVPCLRFLGKEDQVSDFYGEKLSENFVATTLRKVFSHFDLDTEFALLAIDESLSPPAYVLYVEAEGILPESLAEQLDRELRANPHYDLCARLGQLGDVRVSRIHGNAFDVYAKRLSEMGIRIGDIKPTPLSRHSDWNHYFDADR